MVAARPQVDGAILRHGVLIPQAEVIRLHVVIVLDALNDWAVLLD